MKKIGLRFSVVFLSIACLSACGIYETKDNSGLSSSGAPLNFKAGQISYAQVQSSIFQPNCVQCHSSYNPSGGVTLDSYAGVKASLSLVKNEVEGKTMPPAGPLSDNKIQMVSEWIDAGAPEAVVVSNPEGSPTPAASPTPTATPSLSRISFAQVQTAIFNPSCVSCHSGSRPKGGVLLDTYANVKKNLSGAQSEIDSQDMPPSEPISDSNTQLLADWITQGAVEVPTGN